MSAADQQRKIVPGEISGYFDDCAGIWDRNYGSAGAMRGRIDLFGNALKDRIDGSAQVLDFGCGSGQISIGCHDLGYHMSGCDISPRMIETAKANAGNRSIDFAALPVGSKPQLPYEDGRFDAAIASSVFEYVADPVPWFRELSRVLRPGGWLLLSVPDMRHPVRTAETGLLARYRRWPMRLLISVSPRRMPWRARYDYLRLSVNRASLDQWAVWLRAAGFNPEPVPGCGGPLVLLVGRR